MPLLGRRQVPSRSWHALSVSPRGVLPRAALTERSTRCRAPRHGRTGCISHRFDELGDPLGPRVGAFRPDQRPRACPRFADVAPTYVPRFRRMPHRAASVASTKPRSTNFLTGCSSSARQTVAGARSGDPSVDALGIHRAHAASLEPASGADHAAIVDHRPAHPMGIGRSAPAPDGSWLVRRVSWADLQLHRICTVSRQRSSRSGSPSISDPAASRRFHSNT